MFSQENEPIMELTKTLPEDIQEALEDFIALTCEQKQKALEKISFFLSQASSKKELREKLSAFEHYIRDKQNDPKPSPQRSETEQEIHNLLIGLIENRYLLKD